MSQYQQPDQDKNSNNSTSASPVPNVSERSSSSGSGSSSDGADVLYMTPPTIGQQLSPPPPSVVRASSTRISRSEPPSKSGNIPVNRNGRPILKLAMLNAQEKAKMHAQMQVEEDRSMSAPVRDSPPKSMELPSTGYFAPRGVSRANTTTANPNASLLLNQIPQDESAEKSIGNNGILPQGLRRRVTRAKANLIDFGRNAFNPATTPGSTISDTEDALSDTDHEKRLEELMDAHAGDTAETAPTNNIEANNAEITSQPDFYPINLSTENPGVIHMNMSGHEAAKNIVESVLGSIGSSTSQYKKTHPEETAAVTTPSDLEAGMGGKRVKFADDTTAPQYPQAPRFPPASGMPAHSMMPPLGELGSTALPMVGLDRSNSSLRGVYANLSKLQSRMLEHHEKREQRMRELRQKEEKRRREEEKRRREEEKRRREERERESRRRERTEHSSFNTVSSRIRDLPERLAAKGTKAVSHVRTLSASPSPPSAKKPPTTPGGGLATGSNGSPLDDKNQQQSKFVLNSFKVMPRPESITNIAELLGTIPRGNSPLSRSQPNSPGATAPSLSAVATTASSSAMGDGSYKHSPHSPSPSLSPTPSPHHLPHHDSHSPRISPISTPGWDEVASADTIGGIIGGARGYMASSDTDMQAFEAEKQKILAQLADIFNRQNFLLVASRTLMGFGAPLHRLEANLVAIALHLDVAATFAALPGIILITFGDEDNRTSETYVVRMTPGYDMHRLERTNRVIRRVLKGRLPIGSGVKQLERILATPPLYPWWVMISIYVLCSFFICPLFWGGSWRDAGVSAMLGLIVGLLQLMAGRFANYANLFEVSSAFVVSFISAGLQQYVCFATVSFSGIAMLLPGLALTSSIIEMASRNMITGSVRFIFAMCRCFMLGYGISVGSTLGIRIMSHSDTIDLLDNQKISFADFGNCNDSVNKYWWFMLLPLLSLGFNMAISAHWRQWPAMVLSGCLAYVVSYFSSMSQTLTPLAPAIAAFAMGLFANILATFSNHRSAIEPILGGVQLLVPGSLGLRTVLAFITSSGNSSGNFLYDMFSTSLSISVGLFLSGMVIFPNRKKRVGLMTF